MLPILSKLLEKHICDHLCDFLEENALLHWFQSGFRKFHSTESALIRLVDQLLFDLDKNRASGLVFIDYKKAFDLIDHGLLLEKLKAYGVCDNELELLCSYLSGRTQYVHINGCHSSPRTVSAGVPQGSILGPILFLLFINDLPLVAQHSTVDIYADDTTLSLSSDVINGLTAMSSALQQDLDDVSRWSAANKMVTNAAKTKCLLVTGKRIPCKLDNCSLELKLVNSDIEQVDSQKLLGVTIDKHLSFDVHVEELCKKLSQRIAVLRKIRRFIPIEQRILYYNAMIKQVMLYGSTIWSNCSADNLTRILKLQKRAARVILGADTRSNSVNLFKKLGWLPFYDEAKVNKCSLVLKRLQGNCPSYMYDLLKCNADLHTRSGRYSALNLVCPRYNRESEGGRTFSVSATRLWNSLPINLKKGTCVTSFRKAIYSHFLSRYNDVDHFSLSET